jgi:hypothetical protein
MIFTAIVFVGVRLIVSLLFPRSFQEMPLLLSPIYSFYGGRVALVSAAVGFVVAACMFKRPRRETIGGLMVGSAVFTILWWLGISGSGASFLNWYVWAHCLTLAVEVVTAGWLAISALRYNLAPFERSEDAQIRDRT